MMKVKAFADRDGHKIAVHRTVRMYFRNVERRAKKLQLPLPLAASFIPVGGFGI